MNNKIDYELSDIAPSKEESIDARLRAIGFCGFLLYLYKKFLIQNDISVGEVADDYKCSRSNAYSKLQFFQTLGLVDKRQVNPRQVVYYGIPNSEGKLLLGKYVETAKNRLDNYK